MRGGLKPMIAAQRVDFPIPLRPRTAIDSWPTEKLTFWRACAPP